MNSNNINYKKYEDKGLTGLTNLGNTCFINSCIQVLSNTYELNDFLDKETYKKRLNDTYDSALLIEWDNLRKLMWSQNCIISPGKFIKTIQKLSELKGIQLFTGYDQNDIAEFLLFVVDCFHNSICREVDMKISGSPDTELDRVAVKCYEMIRTMYSKEYSEIWSMFYGIHVSQIISNETQELLNYTPEPYFTINLPIPTNNKSPNIMECFDMYVSGEVMEGDNAWYNEKTDKKEDVTKKIVFWSFPKILAIDFKRFNNRNIKNQTRIDFPLENLDLVKYSMDYKKNTYIYDLYGVCNHSGSVYGGHYTAYIKNANGKWYHYNDTNVEEVKDLEKIVSPKAYCLFYRKKMEA